MLLRVCKWAWWKARGCGVSSSGLILNEATFEFINILEYLECSHGTHYNSSSQDGDVMRFYLNIQKSNNNLENAQAGRAVSYPALSMEQSKQSASFLH